MVISNSGVSIVLIIVFTVTDAVDLAGDQSVFDFEQT